MPNSYKRIQTMMVFILIVSLLAPSMMMEKASAADLAASASIQPALAEIAAESPDELVRIIVQKVDSTDEAENLVEHFGGKVIKELDLINAFAAELAAKDISKLARTAAVNWVSLDATVVSMAKKVDDPEPVDLTPNTYLETLNVPPVWEMGYQGQGISVAVIDSGISKGIDFVDDFDLRENSQTSRILTTVALNADLNSNDNNGHGSHVAGIIGGNGGHVDGLYAGVAPLVNFVALNVSDLNGMAYESDVVAALQWVYDNQDFYNIRVVNLSIQSTVMSSYHESPMNAAAEILWFNGIVVVTAAGNYWSDLDFNPVRAAPANDPFLITVGAVDEKGTVRIQDDVVANFSAFGTTLDGYFKPDIYAPGKGIISVLAQNSQWDEIAPERVVADKYIRLSGTSMAAPMVTGAVALLLQAEPELNPDQIKYRLIQTAGWVGPVKYLNIYSAITTPTTDSANQDLIPHMLLAKMAMMAYWATAEGEENIDWENVDWDAVNWDAVNWNAVNWNAVNWNAVNWNAVNWNAVNWNAVNWNAVNWNAVNWNAVNWNAVNWNSVHWDE